MADQTPEPRTTASLTEQLMKNNQIESSEENELKPAYWRRWYFWLSVFLVVQILFFSLFTSYFK